MDEEVRALVVRVVRDEQPGRERGGRERVVRVQRFEQLGGLGEGSGSGECMRDAGTHF